MRLNTTEIWMNILRDRVESINIQNSEKGQEARQRQNRRKAKKGHINEN